MKAIQKRLFKKGHKLKSIISQRLTNRQEGKPLFVKLRRKEEATVLVSGYSRSRDLTYNIDSKYVKMFKK